ncbi:inorganic phosphate transporter [Methylocucumis oryzae]|uniref:Phosphate transporter n=1 Tax=Methylocucumis oryzae TaxID=1632867 RepID=A0A0F3IG48_9GAMM|nr:inorganic phosphate transporter [Methylocucumis oryzae]KJV05528.1 phosphate permease [Methylocucumis oryzae]
MSNLLLVISVMLLAYANGANDNFKGVATLFGSGTAAYRRALYWASWATAAGACCSLYLAHGLLLKFSGKGLTPDTLLQTPAFLLAVATGAGMTVLSATRLGLPISTTHALLGAMVGVTLLANQGHINAMPLWHNFVLPLLISPLLSLFLAMLMHWVITHCVTGKRLKSPVCLCVEPQNTSAFAYSAGGLIVASSVPSITVDQQTACAARNATIVLGVSAQRWQDSLHYLSAGCVCFARGLNDTPKIAALLWLTPDDELVTTVVFIALAMLLGGLLNARRVAITMSHNITTLDHQQGLAANMTTALLVVIASRFGIPVSTTHVAVGALVGIGWLNGQPKYGMIMTILLSWLLTLPSASLFAACVYWVMESLVTGVHV